MVIDYSHAVAVHYAAYRPPLHQLILRRALRDKESFADGLDAGCGTGRSSIALAEFCERVYAVEPSQEMLDEAIPHDAITYLRGCCENIPLPDRSVDIITFAGSLFYVDIDATAKEVSRVCRPNALIVPYDFEVRIDEILDRLGVATHVPESTYDHRANLSGISGFTAMEVEQDRIQIDVTATDLAHVLLADAVRHDAFASRYKTATPFQRLAADLGYANESIAVRADIFYSTYRLAGHLSS